MYAIIETGGKQYRVVPGQILDIERLPGDVGTNVKIDHVLLVGNKAEGQEQSEQVHVGSPYLAGATLEGEIVAQSRGEKIFMVKYKRRKGYRKTQGHRQELTRLLITKISDGKGGQLAFDASKRKEVLMHASIPSSDKVKAAKKAAPKTEKTPVAKKAAAPKTAKTAKAKKA